MKLLYHLPSRLRIQKPVVVILIHQAGIGRRMRSPRAGRN
jgi:hypothetical protein